MRAGAPVSLGGKLWRRAIDWVPTTGFCFSRPVVLFQSDDWGRVGVRDLEGFEQLCSAGVVLGERPYDFYTLETAADLVALCETLKRHRDSAGRHPCVEMNFIVANLDFSKMNVGGWRQIRVLPLSDGLPEGWVRSGLMEAYREGIADRVFCPALHGTTHFCRPAVQRALTSGSERSKLLHILWQAGTPYIHWRMPWIGYEYWDPDQPEDQRFLPAEPQREFIGQAVGSFAKTFSSLPRSACAPGYRANYETHSLWAQHGIRVAQNGPGGFMPPHFDRYDVLHLSRTVEFEPATDSCFSLEACIRQVESCVERRIPIVVSMHSINFHSTIRDFRTRTLEFLEEFLTRIESKYPDLIYLQDAELCELIQNGANKATHGTEPLNVVKRKFVKPRLRKRAD